MLAVIQQSKDQANPAKIERLLAIPPSLIYAYVRPDGASHILTN